MGRTVIELVAEALCEDMHKELGEQPWENAGEVTRAVYRSAARAVLTAALGSVEEWLAFQIANGHAPDGAPVEMTPEYAAGRRSAFTATRAMLATLGDE